MANTQNNTVDYEEELKKTEADKQTAITESNALYDNMIKEGSELYDGQITAAKDWADQQKNTLQEQTDFAIDEIDRQKAQAQKDYEKEQSAAYTDYQKQTNPYGFNAEQMAESGLTNSGFSESSKVSKYNAYQIRVAVARAAKQQLDQDFDNGIREAKLQNSAALAELAYQTYQTQLELLLEGFNYKNNLLLEQASQKRQIEQTYYNRWQDTLAQLNRQTSASADTETGLYLKPDDVTGTDTETNDNTEGGFFAKIFSMVESARAAQNNSNEKTDTGTTADNEYSELLASLRAAGYTTEAELNQILAEIEKGTLIAKKIDDKWYIYKPDAKLPSSLSGNTKPKKDTFASTR